MQRIHIKGGNTLSGQINISGAKNSVVALVPAALLSNEVCTIANVPDISDVTALKSILELLNCSCSQTEDILKIDPTNIKNVLIPNEYAGKLRASYYFMGVLLSRFKQVDICFPGGCNIGNRSIDYHLASFQKMGATVDIDGDKCSIKAEKLHGAFINLDFASVGATINIMFAAVLAEGTTIINNAAREPEIVNIASFLVSMGAKITGAGTSRIKIIGVTELHRGFTEVIPDRIEAGTYLIAGALIGKDLVINNIIPTHIEALITKLKESGARILVYESSIKVTKEDNLKPIKVQSRVFPGFATDLGQQLSVYLTQLNGFSSYEETIYENRMQHVKYLTRMGADMVVNGQKLICMGPRKLHGSKVVATDLRGGACMVLAGLIADGDTYISEIHHILRGYENIVEKLSNVGANIEIIE